MNALGIKIWRTIVRITTLCGSSSVCQCGFVNKLVRILKQANYRPVRVIVSATEENAKDMRTKSS
jgi:glutaredoxin-related protein